MTAVLAALKPEDAIKALKARGQNLSPSFAWQDVYAEEHARQFTVAKSAGFDILNDLFDGLQSSLEDGKTFRDFAAQVKPLLQAKGWWGVKEVTDPLTGRIRPAQLGSTRRLQLIFDANMRVSYAAGHWVAFERNKRLRPWLRYVCILDDRTRPEHRKRHNLCLHVDHPYWDTWAPPCGWNCRCTLQSLSDRDVERMRSQLIFTPPSDDLITFTNRRTGEIRSIPRGIDPGWDHNPGKQGFLAMDAAEKLINAPPGMAAQMNADPDWLVKPIGDDYHSWYEATTAGTQTDRSVAVVGALQPEAVDKLTSSGLPPASAAITITQPVLQRMAGGNIDIDLLRTLPLRLSRPSAVLLDKRTSSLLYVFDAIDSPVVGRIVFQVGFPQKTAAPAQRAQLPATNAIRGISIIGQHLLNDRDSYLLLAGSLDR
jgi:SPP1 gp7 family putative phage head morphogenesis protein